MPLIAVALIYLAMVMIFTKLSLAISRAAASCGLIIMDNPNSSLIKPISLLYTGLLNLEIYAQKVYTYSVSIKVGYHQSTVSEFSQCPEVLLPLGIFCFIRNVRTTLES